MANILVQQYTNMDGVGSVDTQPIEWLRIRFNRSWQLPAENEQLPRPRWTLAKYKTLEKRPLARMYGSVHGRCDPRSHRLFHFLRNDSIVHCWCLANARTLRHSPVKRPSSMIMVIVLWSGTQHSTRRHTRPRFMSLGPSFVVVDDGPCAVLHPIIGLRNSLCLSNKVFMVLWASKDSRQALDAIAHSAPEQQTTVQREHRAPGTELKRKKRKKRNDVASVHRHSHFGVSAVVLCGAHSFVSSAMRSFHYTFSQFFPVTK